MTKIDLFDNKFFSRAYISFYKPFQVAFELIVYHFLLSILIILIENIKH
jgi:hypothetical protein